MAARLLRIFKSKVGVVFASALVLAVAYSGLYGVDELRAVEGQLLDWRFNLRGAAETGEEIVIVEIDDASVLALGGWPLPRESLAALVDALSADDAKVIAIDLLLVDSAGSRGRKSGSGDRALATALSRAGNVILPFAFTFDSAEANYRQAPPEIAEVAYQVVQETVAARNEGSRSPSGLLAPPKRFLRPAYPAQVNVFLEDDGALREANPVIGFGERYFPSLPVEALRLYLDQPRTNVVLHAGEGISIGDLFVPTDSEMGLPVNYYGPGGSFDHYSLTDVLERRVPAGTFKDRIVLVGATALGVGDAFSTPFSGRLPGVEHFATVIDNMLHGRILRRADWTFGIDLLVIIACALSSLLLLLAKRPIHGVVLGVGLVAACLAGNLIVFAAANVWLNLTFPIAALILSLTLLMLCQVISEQTRHEVAEGEGAQPALVVSPLASEERGIDRPVDAAPSSRPPLPERTAAAQRAAAPAPAPIPAPIPALRAAAGDSRQLETRGHHATVVFADLKGFTTLSENLSPGETMTLLRRFHRLVERAIISNSGVIDKFVGDGAMAVFGVPNNDPSAALNAVRAVRQLIAEVEKLNAELSSQNLPTLDVRAGLHFGPVTLGTLGGGRQAQVTVTGDTVNVASRLESLTRNQDAKVIASDAVIESARAAGGDAAIQGFCELPTQNIRGRRRPLGVWALYLRGREPAEASPLLLRPSDSSA